MGVTGLAGNCNNTEESTSSLQDERKSPCGLFLVRQFWVGRRNRYWATTLKNLAAPAVDVEKVSVPPGPASGAPSGVQLGAGRMSED